MSLGTILVTGGAGYIGSVVTKELNESGYKTVVYDNLSTGTREAVIQGEFVKGDIGDRHKLSRVFDQYKPLAVIHLAASISIADSELHRSEYIKNNLINTQTLVEEMIAHKVDKIVFSSTAAVFGNPDKCPITEEAEKKPINVYGETKLLAERYLVNQPVKSCIFRFFNVAGGDPDGQIKNYKTAETNLIPVVLKNYWLGKSTTIYGSDYPTKDGTAVRDFVHVKDVARAHILGLERLLKGGDSCDYNLGSGTGFSVKQVLDTAETVLGEVISRKIGPRRSGDPAVVIASSEKAWKELGWIPEYVLKEMIQDAKKSYLE